MKNYRPRYHITPKQGWINDPNGFVFFRGEFHLFAQHNPFATQWGPMHWLHFVSKDLLHFEEVGIALAPEEPYEREWGCFSGSAVVKDDTLYLLYTGVSDNHQTQCLAYSKDGRHFEKYQGNPVLSACDLPEGYLIADFRDPKIFVKGDEYFVLLAARHKEGYSSLLCYKSKDLKTYRYVGESYRETSLLNGGMIECPDICFDGERCALILSLQNKPQVGDAFGSSHCIVYSLGRFDTESGHFEQETSWRELDRGFDAYATQTLCHNGHCYLVYWQSSWDVVYPSVKEGYAGVLSSIKEIKFGADSLLIQPLPSQKAIQEEDSFFAEYRFRFLSNKAFILFGGLLKMELDLASKQARFLRLGEDIASKGSKTISLPALESEFALSIFIDHSCLELYLPGGLAFSLNAFKMDVDVSALEYQGLSLI